MKLTTLLLPSLLVFFFIGVGCLPYVSEAQVGVGKDAGKEAASGAGLTADIDAKQVILNVINFFLTLVGVIAVAMLIYAGFRYMTSLGDESKTESAKTMIFYVIVGLALIILSAAIVNLVLEKLIA